MGLADKIRIMLGHLTPDEQAERDAAARRRTEAANQQAQRKQQSAAAEATRQQQHRERIQRAAAISSVELICHEDTWYNIKFETRRHIARYSGTADAQKLSEGRLAIRLSGPELAIILQELGKAALIVDDWYVRSDADRAVALQVYRAVSRVVDQADPDADPSRPLPPIVLAAGAARRADEDDDPNQQAGTPARKA